MPPEFYDQGAFFFYILGIVQKTTFLHSFFTNIIPGTHPFITTNIEISGPVNE
jgi:hypothetical protein